MVRPPWPERDDIHDDQDGQKDRRRLQRIDDQRQDRNAHQGEGAAEAALRQADEKDSGDCRGKEDEVEMHGWQLIQVSVRSIEQGGKRRERYSSPKIAAQEI